MHSAHGALESDRAEKESIHDLVYLHILTDVRVGVVDGVMRSYIPMTSSVAVRLLLSEDGHRSSGVW